MDEKWCNKCKVMRPITMFYKDKALKSGHQTRCKLCDRLRKRALKLQALQAYGGVCVYVGCNESDPDVLTIDHIGGGGDAHRRQIKLGSGNPFYVWLHRNNYPSAFQVLCANHQIKTVIEKWDQKFKEMSK